MKLFIGATSIVISTLLGYLFSRKYTKKKLFYCNFDNFNKILKSEIAFSQKTLKEIIKTQNLTNNDFLINFLSFLKDKDKFNLKIDYISNDEKNFLLEYYENIGKTEKGCQLEFLRQSEENLYFYYKNAMDSEKKYKLLCIKLGFLVGLIIFILVI